MADDLATLIRLCRLNLDGKRKALALLLTKQEEMQQMKAAVLQRLADEQEQAVPALEGGRSLGAFVRASFAKRDEIDAAIRELEKLIEMAREDLRVVFEELKRYETAQEQRVLRRRRQAQRKDIKALDEAGGETRRRREEQGGDQ